MLHIWIGYTILVTPGCQEAWSNVDLIKEKKMLNSLLIFVFLHQTTPTVHQEKNMLKTTFYDVISKDVSSLFLGCFAVYIGLYCDSKIKTLIKAWRQVINNIILQKKHANIDWNINIYEIWSCVGRQTGNNAPKNKYKHQRLYRFWPLDGDRAQWPCHTQLKCAHALSWSLFMACR